MKIKDWYMTTYSEDPEGSNIDPNASFEEMDHYEVRNIYDYLGVYDSIIRERVFEKLASLLNYKYSEIYDIWINQ
jgi:hypothetical protein